jgi:putative Holliday junction resolvase
MALDWGERRVGVAMSDEAGLLAQPLETIERRPRGEPLLDRLAWLVKEYGVREIVVGLPLHMDGRSGPEAERVRAFGAIVAERTGVPVDYLDERWTSREAERVLGEAGASRTRRRAKRQRTDPVAAALILRTYLDRRTGS